MHSKKNLKVLDFSLLETFWKKMVPSACRERETNPRGYKINKATVQP
jgi:hypothetical protein